MIRLIDWLIDWLIGWLICWLYATHRMQKRKKPASSTIRLNIDYIDWSVDWLIIWYSSDAETEEASIIYYKVKNWLDWLIDWLIGWLYVTHLMLERKKPASSTTRLNIDWFVDWLIGYMPLIWCRNWRSQHHLLQG